MELQRTKNEGREYLNIQLPLYRTNDESKPN